MNILEALNELWCGLNLGHFWRRYDWGAECIKCGKIRKR